MFLFSFFGLDRAQNTIGSLSNPRRRRQRERHQTKGLISITMAVHGRYKSLYISLPFSAKKDLANEDTLLRTHCCRHKCFPVCPTTQHLLRTQILCLGQKNVSDFVQKHFGSATNVSLFAQPKKHHGQQCVRNNVSQFTGS